MNRPTWAQGQVPEPCAVPPTAQTILLRVKYHEKTGIDKRICNLILAPLPN